MQRYGISLLHLSLNCSFKNAPRVFCIWHIAWMQKYGEFDTEKHNAQGESIDAYERSSERNQEQKFNRC